MAAPLTVDQDLAAPSLDGVDIPSPARTDAARRKSRIAAAGQAAYVAWLLFLFATSSFGIVVLQEPALTIVDVTFAFAVFVAFVVWVYEAYRIAGMLSRFPMDSTPGWAVGVFFIPIANLWLPFSRLKEIDAVSGEAAAVAYSESGRDAGLLALWWALWVTAAVATQLYVRLGIETPWLGLAAGLGTVASSVLSALVALRIHDAQEAAADRLAAAAHETAAPPDEGPGTAQASGARLF